MLRNKVRDLIDKVQCNTSCHQKYRQVLLKLYTDTSSEDFEIEFMRCVEIIFVKDLQPKNPYAERVMEFFGSFIAGLASTSSTTDDNDTDCHPFTKTIMINILKDLPISPYFFKNLKEDAVIDGILAESLEKAMLQSLEDEKPNIRIQAVKALTRLQQADNTACPVIKALLKHIYDRSLIVRKEVVESIAFTLITIPKILERVQDSEHNVRSAAYKRCAILNPQVITIVNRQFVLDSGFNEKHAQVKGIFIEDTLHKWLSAYNGNYLAFLKALKLDAYEQDLVKSEMIAKHVIEAFLKCKGFTSLLEYLPLENNLVPVNQLTNEAALFWYILINYYKNQSTDLEDILPELIHFCSYIEEYFKNNTSENTTTMEYLEFQYVLCSLFKIAGCFDISDETGRKTLKKLIEDMLIMGNLRSFVIKEMVHILAKIDLYMDCLSRDILNIISKIRTVKVDKPVQHFANQQDHEFFLAQLRVKINVLNDDLEKAVKESEFEKASSLKKEVQAVTKQFEEMSVTELIETVLVDDITTLRCLNILNETLSHPNLRVLTIPLRVLKDEFVTPLLAKNNENIYVKAFKCVILYCLLDRNLVKDYLEALISPIILYELLPNYNKDLLLLSIAAFSDLTRLYGIEILNDNKKSGSSAGSARRLHNSDQLESSTALNFTSVSHNQIIEILLNLLDDEIEELREQAAMGLSTLLVSGISVSSTMLTRMILKWLNPMTEKHDQKLQQILGNGFMLFAQEVENSRELLESTVIPILTGIIEAPRTSPLAEIDIEDTLRFLSAITSVVRESEAVCIHKDLAFSVCYKILSDPSNKCVTLLIRLLIYLELEIEDHLALQDLINQMESVLNCITDKRAKQKIENILKNLNSQLDKINNPTDQSINSNVIPNASSTPIVSNTHTSSSSDETTHRKTVDKKKAHKRRKRRGQSSLQTIVENCDASPLTTEINQIEQDSTSNDSHKSVTNALISDTSSDSEPVKSKAGKRPRK